MDEKSHMYSIFSTAIILENTQALECEREYHFKVWSNSTKFPILFVSRVGCPSESRENALLEDYLYNSLHPSEVVVEDLTSFVYHPCGIQQYTSSVTR